jgi:hypothetical protein
MNTDPTLDEMRAFLAEQYGPELDEFDREEAIYWFATDWHGGQWSNLYAALCASQYKPGPMCNGPDNDTLASEAFEQLEIEFTQWGQDNVAMWGSR